jgi:hypothetical protein
VRVTRTVRCSSRTRRTTACSSSSRRSASGMAADPWLAHHVQPTDADSSSTPTGGVWRERRSAISVEALQLRGSSSGP